MTLREETASSRLSLEAETDQFRLKEEREVQEKPVEILDSKGELDKSSIVRSPRLIVAWVDSSFEEEEEMTLNARKGLKELLVGRNKGSSSKDAPRSHPLLALLPHLSPSTVGLLPIPNLKKKRKEKEIVEEGEVVPQKEPK